MNMVFILIRKNALILIITFGAYQALAFDFEPKPVPVPGLSVEWKNMICQSIDREYPNTLPQPDISNINSVWINCRNRATFVRRNYGSSSEYYEVTMKISAYKTLNCKGRLYFFKPRPPKEFSCFISMY